MKIPQAANIKQAARHSKEVEELLLELSKQHAAAQAALPQQGTFKQGTSGKAVMNKRALPDQEEEEDVTLAPQAPRLTTPVSPSRRPSTNPTGFHTPPEQTPTPVHVSRADGYLQKDDSLRAERGRSFTNSFSMSKHYPMDLPHVTSQCYGCHSNVLCRK